MHDGPLIFASSRINSHAFIDARIARSSLCASALSLQKHSRNQLIASLTRLIVRRIERSEECELPAMQGAFTIYLPFVQFRASQRGTRGPINFRTFQLAGDASSVPIGPLLVQRSSAFGVLAGSPSLKGSHCFARRNTRGYCCLGNLLAAISPISSEFER